VFNFRPNLPWLRLRPEIPDDSPPGFRLTPENPLGFSPPSRGAGDLPDILTGIAQGTAVPSSGDISWPYASLVHFPRPSERQWQPAQPSLNVGGQFGPGEAAPGFFDELPSSPLGIDFREERTRRLTRQAQPLRLKDNHKSLRSRIPARVSKAPGNNSQRSPADKRPTRNMTSPTAKRRVWACLSIAAYRPLPLDGTTILHQVICVAATLES
jgi:hypothetical protein